MVAPIGKVYLAVLKLQRDLIKSKLTWEMRCLPARASILDILSVRKVLDTRKAP